MSVPTTWWNKFWSFSVRLCATSGLPTYPNHVNPSPGKGKSFSWENDLDTMSLIVWRSKIEMFTLSLPLHLGSPVPLIGFLTTWVVSLVVSLVVSNGHMSMIYNDFKALHHFRKYAPLTNTVQYRAGQWILDEQVQNVHFWMFFFDKSTTRRQRRHFKWWIRRISHGFTVSLTLIFNPNCHPGGGPAILAPTMLRSVRVGPFEAMAAFPLSR